VEGAKIIRGGVDVTTIGTVDSLWRYPVKGMRGEALSEAFMGFAGLTVKRIMRPTPAT